MRRIGLTPWTPKMIERTLCLTGGAVEAIHAVKYGGITGNMAGGTHHAHRDFGSGYCVFNDLAISAMYAIEHLGVNVAISTWTCIKAMEQQQFSRMRSGSNHFSHCSTNFPFRKSVSDFDLPVEPNSGDVRTWKKSRKRSIYVLISNRSHLVSGRC